MHGFSTTTTSGSKQSLSISYPVWFQSTAARPLFYLRRVIRHGRGIKTLATLLLLAGWLAAAPAMARTLEVGPTRDLTGPGAAAAVAQDGDRVVFDPGIYRDCAIWAASRLTLEVRRPSPGMKQTIMNATVITGPACADRALFLFAGNDIAVRGLTFVHARDTDHNGAGILMEGANLTVENSQFLDNENGILAGGPVGGVLLVRRSLFQGNGSCEGACAHALYAGRQLARVEVTGCTFVDTHIGHDIKSRAQATIVRDNRISDGANGTSSYLIDLPNGGDIQIVNNTLQKGEHSDNKETAISIGEQNDIPLNPTHTVDIRGNRFTSDLPEPVWFVRNGTQTPAVLYGNTLIGRVKALEGPGTPE
jgi:hypothetical protein